jgi:tetratricopeptide (TPR) repeat protein
MTADVQLDTLEAKGLIRVAALRPELEYLFRHVLVQDAAYGSLLKQERRDLHGRVGQALEALYPERRAELAPVLAMHFEQAGETDKAIDYYIAAGREGAARNAIHESYGAYERGAMLLQEQPPGQGADRAREDRNRRRRVEIELGRAQVGYSFRAPEEAVAALEAIEPEAEAVGDLDLIARVNMLIALGRIQDGASSDEPRVKRALDRMNEIGESIGDPSLRAEALAIIGLSNVFAGSVRLGVETLEEAVPLLERHDSIGAAFARGALGIGYATLGECDKAEAAVKNAREIAAHGDLIAQLDALIAESMLRSMRGQLDQAVPIAQECVNRATETGASACVVASAWVLGDAYHRQGRFAEAKEILKQGSDISLVVDRKVWRPTLEAWLGSVVAAMGGVPESEYEEGLETARSIGNKLGEAGILWKRAETEAARREYDTAIADLTTSAALLESEGARPNLARVLRSWGEALMAAGRREEAEPVLQRSLRLFEELDLAPEAAGVRTRLAVGETKIEFDQAIG